MSHAPVVDAHDAPSPPVVEMRGIGVSFPGVRALDDVSFRLLPGEVHALMGENGAGKSTLIKALTGVYAIDEGTIRMRGEQVAFSGPAQAQAAGVATVYQEVNLVTNLSVAENIMLGREPRRLTGIDFPKMRRRAKAVLDELNLDIDPGSTLATHSIAVQQLVAIARAIDIDASVLVLDEPTSSLDVREVAELFTVIRRVRDKGVAVLFVSHFLDQIYEISDRITVLRNGRLVGEYRVEELPQLQLVSKMLGRELSVLDALEQTTRRDPARQDEEGRTFLTADALGRQGSISPFDLAVREGEVLGLAGLLGSGRTELARLLCAADHSDHGSTTVDGEVVKLRTPRAALDHKIAYSSENRRAEGVLEELSVRTNIVLALQAQRGLRPIPRRQQDELAAKYIEALDIRPADPDALVKNLSGGNQQKVLLARWLITEPRLLILDEPTRGIDVGAKAQIQRLVAALSDDGVAVIYISAELEEVLRLAHRIIVLRDRRKVAELLNDDITAQDLMAVIATEEASA